MTLAEQKCLPCEGGTMPLFKQRAEELLHEIQGWTLSPDAKKITKEMKFKDFKEALGYTNAVGAIAEAEGHHPDLIVKWGSVHISLSTHSIGGLSENDFILAAKIDKI
jgi:4a-hydroxytetrahydrobiopterin dehydratase